MDRNLVIRRTMALCIVLCLALLTLVGRLWYLQVAQYAEHSERAVRQSTRTIDLPAPRGLILDRSGHILAENRRTFAVGVVPAQYDETRTVVGLASLLPGSMSTLEIATKIRENAGRPAFEVVPVIEGIDDEQRAHVEERLLDLPGACVYSELHRVYPYGSLAAHALGYVGKPSEELLAELQAPDRGSGYQRYGPDSIVGRQGVERFYEMGQDSRLILQGRRGVRVVEVDAANVMTRKLQEQQPTKGADLCLNLDIRLQREAEQALADACGPRGAGAAVVMDARTGDVLTLASLPGFDPNRFVEGMKPAELRKLYSDPRSVFHIRAIAAEKPPGSTFKMISAVAALQNGIIKPSTRFYCGGIIHVGHRHQPFRCWKTHGSVNLEQAIAQSCDTYFYQTVLKGGLTHEMIADYARQFGLGQLTGIDTTGERTGLVPDNDWKMEHLEDRWWPGDTVNMVIGQGFWQVTPLQMAVVTAAIANGGKVLRPHLAHKIVWPDGSAPTVIEPEVVREVKASPETFAAVRRGMRAAVTSGDGTARVVAIPGLAIAAKTGSAEDHPSKKPHAWFAAFAPYEAPKLVCVVYVEHGGHGSEAAGPVARRIFQKALELNLL
jgi:penicillin-binding protein 2